jgi:hypothetical protein
LISCGTKPRSSELCAVPAAVAGVPAAAQRQHRLQLQAERCLAPSPAARCVYYKAALYSSFIAALRRRLYACTYTEANHSLTVENEKPSMVKGCCTGRVGAMVQHGTRAKCRRREMHDGGFTGRLSYSQHTVAVTKRRLSSLTIYNTGRTANNQQCTPAAAQAASACASGQQGAQRPGCKPA